MIIMVSIKKLFSNRDMDMTNGNLFKKIIIFALPLMLSGILQLLYNASDLIIVGNFSDETNAIGAIGSTGSLINMIVNVFMGFSVGANVMLARAIGAKDKKKAHNTVHSSIVLGIIGGIILGFIGYFCSRTFLNWMDTPSDVIDLATVYMQIFFLGMPGNLLYNFGASLLRAKGDTARPLVILFISGLINVILNLFFILVFDMDVDGVAIATIISQYISAILVIICLTKEKEYAKLELSKLRLHTSETLQIIRIGFPAGLQGSIFSVSNVLIQSSVNSFGSVVMNGNSAAANIEGFTYTSMNSIYHAALSFTGQNYGAKKPQNVFKIYIYSLMIVSAIGLLMGGGSYLLGRQLLDLYIDGEAINYGLLRMKYILILYAFCGIMDVTCGMLRGSGYALVPMIISLLGACAFRVFWIYTVFKADPRLEIIYISYPISWILTFIAQFIAFIICKKRVENKLIVN